MSMLRYLVIPAAVALALALTGCSLFAGNVVPDQPPMPLEVALASGQTPRHLRVLIERDPKGNVTGFVPLEKARQAVKKAAGPGVAGAQSGSSLDKAQQALDKAQQSWKPVAEKPLKHPRALARVMHNSRLATGWAQIAQAGAGRDTGLEQLAAARHAAQAQSQSQPSSQPREQSAQASQAQQKSEQQNKWSGVQLIPEQFAAIHFATGTNQLAKASEPVVAKLAAFLLEHDSLSVTIAGYTDNTPPSAAHLKQFIADHPDQVNADQSRHEKSAAYNRWMSGRRAGTVAALLQKHGIDPQRITVVGHGQAQPVASNETAAGRRKNRRVVVTVD